MLSPWYVRNAVDTGNPLYPFGQSVFAGRNWSRAADAYLNVYYDQYRTREAAQRGGKPYKGVEVASFPWDLTMHPESFENGKREGQDVSPFCLAFLPALVLVRSRRATALAMAAIGLAYVVIIVGGRLGASAIRAARNRARARGRDRSPRGRSAAGGSSRWWWPAPWRGTSLLISRMLRPMWPDQVRVALGRMAPGAFLDKLLGALCLLAPGQPGRSRSPVVSLVLEKIPHPYYIERPFVLLSYLEQGLVDYPHGEHAAGARSARRSSWARRTSRSTRKGCRRQAIRSSRR